MSQFNQSEIRSKNQAFKTGILLLKTQQMFANILLEPPGQQVGQIRSITFNKSTHSHAEFAILHKGHCEGSQNRDSIVELKQEYFESRLQRLQNDRNVIHEL